MTFIASMHVKVARRLHSNSLRYWLLEYLRRQPKGRKYRALILKFIKDRMGALLLVEVNWRSPYDKFLLAVSGFHIKLFFAFTNIVFGAVYAPRNRCPKLLWVYQSGWFQMMYATSGRFVVFSLIPRTLLLTGFWQICSAYKPNWFLPHFK